jgi:hypothetical protein
MAYFRTRGFLMSGFTTYNSSGTSAGTGVPGTSAAFNYDPLYTGSVPTQNIPSGTTNIGYIPGSYSLNGSTVLQVTNPASPNLTYPVGTKSDGTKSLLSTLAGDFTVEAWIYPTSAAAASYKSIIAGLPTTGDVSNNWALMFDGNAPGAGTLTWFFNGGYRVSSPVNTIRLNVWQHVAYVRSGTTGTLYYNGVSVATWTDTQTYPTNYVNTFVAGWGASGFWTGNISQPRITSSALYTSTFVPNPVLGLATETVFYAPALSNASVASDLSRSGQTISAFAGTMTYSQLAPANSLSNGVFFPDTTSNIATANSTAFNFGTGNFIVEYWVNTPYTSSTTQRFSMLNSGTGNIVGEYTNFAASIGFGLYNFGTQSPINSTSSYVISPNAWNHIAWGKSGSNLTLWVNGQQISSSVFNSSVNANNWSYNTANSAFFNNPGANVGLGPIRVSNSAVYTTGTNFSPPYTFTNTANTVLLLQGGANLSQYLTDQSVNAIAVRSSGNAVSGSAPTNYGISGNVIGDISGSRNTGLTLRASGVGNATGVIFNNNYGGYWTFNGNTTNSAITSTTQVANSQSSFSQSIWFQTSTANSILTMFQNNISPVTSGSLLNGLVVNATGRLSFYTYLTVALPAQGNIATANVLDNKWHHAAVTYDSTTKTANTYLDGQLGNTLAIGGANNIVSYAGYWTVGGTSQGIAAGVGNAFRGNIGPTAVYTSVLTADQVGQIYRTQAPRWAGTTGVQAGNIVLSSTGTVQSFTVPQGVSQISVRAVGAAGGGTTASGTNQFGGAGANILANIAVVPGSTYYAIVGKGGTSNSNVAGTFVQGGGGAGGLRVSSVFNGAQGGGFTGLFIIDPTTVDANTAVNYAVLIAGGGGGTAGSGGVAVGNGGAAAVSLTGNATQGNSYSVSFAAISIASASSTGTAIVVNMSALGNTSANVMSIGAPVGFSGVGGVTAANVYFVSAANNSSVTAIASPGSFAIPANGTLTLTSATIWPTSRVTTVAANYQGGGGAYYMNNVAYPGGQGFIGGPADAAGIRTATGTVTPAAGAAFAGGAGGSSTLADAYGGGGGGGGYYGGGGGVAASSNGGGGINYAITQLLVGNTVTYGTVNAGGTGNGANGSMTVTWSTATSANYGYSGDVQSFTVPAGVQQITARVIGAAGGGGTNATGGAGANIAANISVTPGQTIYMIVGRGGLNYANQTTAGTLAQGGAGIGGTYSGNTAAGSGGGGFSGIFTQNPSNAEVAASSAILVAGGGGGGQTSATVTNFGGNAAPQLNNLTSPANVANANATSGSTISVGTNLTDGWSSTGTQIVANLSRINGTAVTQVAPANFFATGAAVQITGVGNVLAGQYVTVASASGNLVYMNNGNVVSFPTAGTTGSNPLFTVMDYKRPWQSQFGGAGGGPATPTAPGWYGSPVDSFSGALNSFLTLGTSGAAFTGGNGGNSNNSGYGGGGGGGGGWFGGGGGTPFNTAAGGGGGGSNYVSPSVLNGVTYGTLTTNTSGSVPVHGNIQLSWTNTANFSYTTGTVQTFTVPPYVTRVTARVVGAAGGAALTLAGAYGNAGGAGANISTTLAVTPGQTLYIVVGQGGFSNVQTSGNISQGGGGAAGLYYAGTGQIPGSSGGGFTGIFTQDPSTAANATQAQSSAVLIAGGGGGGTGAGSALLPGGNASTTISANSSPGIGTQSITSTNSVQDAANAISDGTTVTINLTGGATGSAVNFSVGCPVSINPGTFGTTWIGRVVTANTTAITAVYGGGAATPAAGTYTAGGVYAGGYNGSNVQPWNSIGGGWATLSVGGWQGVVSAGGWANTSVRTMPTGGTALRGGNGGGGNHSLSTAVTGGGGGGGWYGGGGGAFGSTITTVSSGGSGGGGSNYGNSQVILANTVSYGTLTTNTGTTVINGYVTFSW